MYATMTTDALLALYDVAPVPPVKIQATNSYSIYRRYDGNVVTVAYVRGGSSNAPVIMPDLTDVKYTEAMHRLAHITDY